MRGRRGLESDVAVMAVQGEINTAPSLPPSFLRRTFRVSTSDHSLAILKGKKRGRQRRITILVLHRFLPSLPPSLSSLLPPVQCGHVRSHPEKPLLLLPSPPQLEKHLPLLHQPPHPPPFLPPSLLLLLFGIHGGGGGGRSGGGSSDEEGRVGE
jgi:hypothetical protein